MATNILTETGTNEAEFLEFLLADQHYCINIEKIKQILKFDTKELTQLPDAHPSLMGTYEFQGQSVPLIDLAKHLKRGRAKAEIQIVLVCEMNRFWISFLVDSVADIHRVSWQGIHVVPPSLEQFHPRLTGIIPQDKRELLVLDFEGIMADIFPEMEVNMPIEQANTEMVAGRSEYKIFFADDSGTFRMGLMASLKEANFTKVRSFENGYQAFRALMDAKKRAVQEDRPIADYVQALVTDVEMPQMDGLTLCRRVKEELPNLPVIILSSLVNDQLVHKCNSINADACLTKKEIDKVIMRLDEFCAA